MSNEGIDEMLKIINREFLDGNISEHFRPKLLALLYGNKSITKHDEEDHDFDESDLQKLLLRMVAKENQRSGGKSISDGNTQERMSVFEILRKDECLKMVEEKGFDFQCQQTGNFFLEISRETEKDSNEYEISKTGIEGESKNMLIKYDLWDTDDNTMLTYHIIVEREGLLKRIKKINSRKTTSYKQKRKTLGWIPSIRDLFWREEDRKMPDIKDERYKEKH
jgi:hypothetical protein